MKKQIKLFLCTPFRHIGGGEGELEAQKGELRHKRGELETQEGGVRGTRRGSYRHKKGG